MMGTLYLQEKHKGAILAACGNVHSTFSKTDAIVLCCSYQLHVAARGAWPKLLLANLRSQQCTTCTAHCTHVAYVTGCGMTILPVGFFQLQAITSTTLMPAEHSERTACLRCMLAPSSQALTCPGCHAPSVTPGALC